MPILPITDRRTGAIVVSECNRSDDEPARDEFRGSGTLLYGEQAHAITAAHVVEGELAEGRALYASVIDLEHEARVIVREIVHVAIHPRLDLAALTLGLEPEDQLYGFTLGLNVAVGADVSSWEHSQTAPYPESDGGTSLILHMSHRKGHIVRTYRSTFGRAAGALVLELSYPALRGASGAPVVQSRAGHKPAHSVVGMLVGNVGTALEPAQVEATYDAEGNVVEEVRYYLPSGIALHLQELRRGLTYLTSTGPIDRVS